MQARARVLAFTSIATVVLGVVTLLAAVPSGGSVAAGNAMCDRACLTGFVDRYLDALIHSYVVGLSTYTVGLRCRFVKTGRR